MTHPDQLLGGGKPLPPEPEAELVSTWQLLREAWQRFAQLDFDEQDLELGFDGWRFKLRQLASDLLYAAGAEVLAGMATGYAVERHAGHRRRCALRTAVAYARGFTVACRLGSDCPRCRG